MNLIDSFQAFHKQELGFIGVLRNIIHHEYWYIAVQGEQPLLVQHQQQNLLLMFSEEESFVKQSGEMEYMIQTGFWVVDKISEKIDAIIIDSNEDHALQLPKEFFPLAKKIVKSCIVEKILQGNQTQRNAIGTLRRFEHFLVPIIQDNEGLTHITLAPDDQGRQFAAVFTAEDCLQAFVTASKNLLGEDLKVNEINGVELFQNLSQLNIEGVVFNCYGPTQPRALSKDFIALICKE